MNRQGRTSSAEPSIAGARQESTQEKTISDINLAQFMAGLDQWKSDIFRGVQEKIEGLEKSLIDKIDGLESDVVARRSRLRGSGISTSLGSNGNRTESTVRKRALPEPGQVLDLDLVAVRDDTWIPFVRITMIYTIMAFAHQCNGSKAWITERMTKQFSSVIPLLGDGVSGMGMIFFSVAGDDAKSVRLFTGLGAAWSTMYTHIMVIMMMTARRIVFSRRPLPPWLESFGDIPTAYAYIKSINEVVEVTNHLPLQREMSRSSKRARRTSDAESTPTVITGSDHPLRPEREVAVRAIRGAVLRALSDARMKARMNIYEALLFVVDEISKYRTRTEARLNGFDIQLGTAITEAENSVPDDMNGIWSPANIPKARVGEGENVDADNTKALENMADCFPSLRVRIFSRREVIGAPRSAVRIDAESNGDDASTGEPGKLYYMDQEEHSLHSLALALMVDTFMMKEHSSLLRSSVHSLRAIHIFAIALRGLIETALGSDPSDMERKALGDVVYRVLTREDKCATVFVGSRNDQEKERKELNKARKSKLSIPYHEYLEKKRKEESESAMDAMSNVQLPIGVRNEGECSRFEEFDVTWMEGEDGDDIHGDENG